MNGMSSVAHISVAVLIVETLPLVMGTFSCDAVYVFAGECELRVYAVMILCFPFFSVGIE